LGLMASGGRVMSLVLIRLVMDSPWKKFWLIN
jgi:hypothetical protein